MWIRYFVCLIRGLEFHMINEIALEAIPPLIFAFTHNSLIVASARSVEELLRFRTFMITFA